MQFRLISLLCASLCVLGSKPCLAEADPARVQAGRQATAFVYSQYEKEAAMGTAFCIDSAGIFVTNHHVVTHNNKPGKIVLVVSSGTRSAKYLPATILAMDAKFDLAILKVNSPDPFNTLELAPPAQMSRLRETQEVIAPGFPLGLNLSVDPRAAPEISINMGRITALRHQDSTLMQIQFDGKMNHGNSGSALLDSSGKVIGYVWGGREGEEINFAYPVTFLHYFLAKSQIVLTPRALLDARAARPYIQHLNDRPLAGRAAIPSEASRKQATTLIHEIFAKRYADKTPHGRAQLVLDLLNRVSAPQKDDVAARYVLLTEARTMAMALGDMENAIYVSVLLASEYDRNEIELITEIVTKPLPAGDAGQQQAGVGATFALVLAEAAAARHEYPQAIKLSPTAKSLAYRTRNQAVVSSVAARVARIEAQGREFEEGMQALEKLKASPSDPAANLAAGRYFGFIMGDFSKAMALFAKCGDPALQAIAKAELAKPGKTDDQKTAGDLWWDQSAKEKLNLAAADACKERAAYWYLQSQAGLSGFARTMVEQRLATVVMTRPVTIAGKPPATQPQKNRVVNLLELTDAARDARASIWHLEKRGLSNESAKASELRFAYKPPEEYDYTMEYSRSDGKWGTCLILTHRGKIFICGLPSPTDHKVSVAPPVGAKEDQLASVLPPEKANGCKVCVQIRKDRITVIVDDKTEINYQAANWTPGERPSFLEANPIALGIVLWYGRIEIRRAEITEINNRDAQTPTPATKTP